MITYIQFKKNQEYTFGVGRGDMKKMFVDDIRK
jgi:hypothetical protein